MSKSFRSGLIRGAVHAYPASRKGGSSKSSKSSRSNKSSKSHHSH
jgi:hypothetical protein